MQYIWSSQRLEVMRRGGGLSKHRAGTTHTYTLIHWGKMSKHSRDEESFDDLPLQRSIKKMKLDGEVPLGAPSQFPTNLAAHYERNTRPEIEMETHMRQMNQLLGSLHSLRLERKAERHRGVSVTPDSNTSSQDHDSYMDTMDTSWAVQIIKVLFLIAEFPKVRHLCTAFWLLCSLVIRGRQVRWHCNVFVCFSNSLNVVEHTQ